MKEFLIVSQELVKNLEFEFPYFKNGKKILETLESAGEEMLQDTATTLAPHLESIRAVNSENKSSLKNNDFKFMENVVLYGGLLRLEQFKSESKKKRFMICKYIGLLAKTVQGKEEVSEVVSELSKNPAIMKLTDSIETKLKVTNVKPEDMLKALLSGKELPEEFRGLVASLTEDIGKMDKKDLDQILELAPSLLG